MKDKHSRSKPETSHKGGEGVHGWGSLRRKGEDEASGFADAQVDLDGQAEARAEDEMFDLDEDRLGSLPNPAKLSDAGNDIRGTGPTNGAANDVEGNIARSPTDSMSSIDSASEGSGGKPAMGGRRMSNVSDEERDRARVYREGALHKGGIDLAHIARTSYGIAQSPPTNEYIGTSPTKVKSGFNFVSWVELNGFSIPWQYGAPESARPAGFGGLRRDEDDGQG
ncbi:hypothetical protein I316_05160 [Kwoniella heveanensis BCC8398]|uniref:Uncharacterized protein n=1 Tax=Kwoniella heveanensis BCC8398 TaxID=1296120 RepID=A0A1B9GQJ8_9TREE|nr:hypothetical protein I316_05160 [Kwoniella heveanensis BCC8398]